jgi:hypothetical protein
MDATFGPIQTRKDDRLPYWCGINKDGSISMIYAQKDTLAKRGGYSKYKWYFNNIATNGKLKSKNKVINNVNSRFHPMLGEIGKSSILLPDGNVLIVTEPDVSIAIFDPKRGEIKDSKTIKLFYEAHPDKLFNDNAGNIYLMVTVGSIGGPHYMQVYPGIDSMNVKVVKMPEVGANYHWNSAISIIGNDKIIVCYRSGEIYNDLEVRNADNVCGYFVMNFNNEIVVPPSNFNYVENAFRKIPNVYLPHASLYNNISKNELPYDIHEGMDFYRLADGQMILTITAFEQDHSLCLYQVKIDNNGKLVKPGKMATSIAENTLNKQFLQNIQTGISVKHFYKGSSLNNASRLLIREQVFWGYDDYGQLYWDFVPLDTLEVLF